MIDACAPLQVWSFQTSWAQLDLESGVGRFVSPPLSVKSFAGRECCSCDVSVDDFHLFEFFTNN